MVPKDTAKRSLASEPPTVEILHQFTGADRPAIAAFITGVKQERNVAVEVVTPSTVSLEVKRRLLKEQPPDLWVDWPGKTLQPYQKPGAISDVTDLWETTDMARKYHEGPQRAARLDGRYYAVPINIHRLNNLFYNVEILEQAGVDPESIESPRGLLSALTAIEAETDAVGILFPFKNQWTSYALQLWEQVMLGQFGIDTYRAIRRRSPESRRDAIRDALDLVRDIASYAPEDAVYLSWGEAQRQFVDGEGAFFAQGDWAASVFHDESDFDLGTAWDHVPFPGTEQLYVMNMDAIVPAADAAHPETAAEVLRYAGSVDGQRRFNVEKGSIPPRTDVPMDGFEPFFRQQMAAFTAAGTQPVQSVPHGQALGPAALVELQGAFSTFLSDWDAEALTTHVVEIFD